MACLSSTDTSWPEVRLIHGFALFMGYLLRGVKGLGVLVVTWTTVVLLGGFVSALEKEDFWSLTVITLVQIIGVFDFIWTERRSNAEFLYRGSRTLHSPHLSQYSEMKCPVQHDYNNNGDAGAAANLKPALLVLYSLAIAQGVLFGYKSIYALGARIALVKEVASVYFPDQPDLVSEYIDVTVKGCEKDTSFPRGRNLITYAVDLLLESSSHDRYISGVRILGTLIRPAKPADLMEQRMAIRQLMTASESFRHMIHRLLEMLGPRTAYSEEVRDHAATILAHVASDIRLEQFPRAVPSISSLLDTSEEHIYTWVPEDEYELPWLPPVDGCKEEMLLQGLLIFWKLTDDEENCRVISNTQGLLPKLMAPLISGSSSTHRDHPREWSEAAEVSMELMTRLLAAPGDAGTKLQREISSNDVVITALQGILKCGGCGAELKKQAIGVLLDLSVDTSSFLADQGSCIVFTITLLNLFLFGMVRIRIHQPQPQFRQKRGQVIGRYHHSSSTHWMKKRTDNTNFAAEKLLSSGISETRSATLILQAAVDDEVLGHLARATVRGKNNTHRMRAAQILRHVCSHYTEDDGYLTELKAAMADVMPKILREALGEETQEVIEADKSRYSAPGADLEEGCASREGRRQRSPSSHKHNLEHHEAIIELKESLISLCATVCDRWMMNADSAWARQFNEIATAICLEQGKPVKTVTSLVEEAKGLLKTT